MFNKKYIYASLLGIPAVTITIYFILLLFGINVFNRTVFLDVFTELMHSDTNLNLEMLSSKNINEVVLLFHQDKVNTLINKLNNCNSVKKNPSLKFMIKISEANNNETLRCYLKANTLLDEAISILINIKTINKTELNYIIEVLNLRKSINLVKGGLINDDLISEFQELIKSVNHHSINILKLETLAEASKQTKSACIHAYFLKEFKQLKKSFLRVGDYNSIAFIESIKEKNIIL